MRCPVGDRGDGSTHRRWGCDACATTDSRFSPCVCVCLQSRMFGGGKHRVAAANFGGAKKKAPAPMFAGKRR